MGFIWFGTENGLNRYDGYNFHYYGPEAGLGFANVYRLAQTKDGLIWIGTKGGGLNQMIYDSAFHTSRFIHYLHDPVDDQSLSDEVVLSLCEDRDGNIWAGCFRGLNILRKGDREQFVKGRTQKPVFYRV